MIKRLKYLISSFIYFVYDNIFLKVKSYLTEEKRNAVLNAYHVSTIGANPLLVDDVIPNMNKETNSDVKIVFGKYCSIAKGVKFITGEHDYLRPSTYFLKTILCNHCKKDSDGVSKGSIIIGNDFWIGSNSIVLSNVSVGDGAVIGAGSVVTTDIPPYAIAVGVPAKVIKYRFTKKQIKKMLKIKWWDWLEEFIIKNINIFYLDIDTFIDCAEQIHTSKKL